MGHLEVKGSILVLTVNSECYVENHRSVEISGPYPLSMKSLVNLAAIAHTPLHSDQEVSP